MGSWASPGTGSAQRKGLGGTEVKSLNHHSVRFSPLDSLERGSLSDAVGMPCHAGFSLQLMKGVFGVHLEPF